MGISSVEYRGESREKTIVFKIENLTEYLKMSNKELEENGIIFNAGSCTLTDGTEMPATWKYYFERTSEYGEREKWFGECFVLRRPTNRADVKSASASWTVSLSSGGNWTVSFLEEKKEFAGPSGLPRSNRILTSESQLVQSTRRTDVLEVTLLVKVFSNNTDNSKPILGNPSTSSAEQLRGQILSDYVKMLESGDGADVDIKVPSAVGEIDESSYTRKAHKGILMSRSSVFAKIFAKDSTMTEAVTGVVVIKDLSPKGLDVFLHYLYTGEVVQDWGQVGLEILNAAEKYDCGPLKEYCGSNIMDAVSTSNALELYKSANLHGLLDAAEGVADFISINTKAVLKQALGFISKNTEEIIIMDQVVEESQ